MKQKKIEKRRFDDKRIRLQKGETQRPNGSYEFRWTTPDGKRHSVYAPTIVQLREQERLIIVDEHDGIKTDVKGITVNEVFKRVYDYFFEWRKRLVQRVLLALLYFTIN